MKIQRLDRMEMSYVWVWRFIVLWTWSMRHWEIAYYPDMEHCAWEFIWG